jgi:hypothetical protein
MPPKKHFHSDKNPIEKDCLNEEKKLFAVDSSKKIKTFENGWL